MGSQERNPGWALMLCIKGIDKSIAAAARAKAIRALVRIWAGSESG